MKVKAVNDKRVNRVGPLASAGTERLTIKKALAKVTTAPIVTICGYEDNASVQAVFSIVGTLDAVGNSVVAPATEAIVENVTIFNTDTIAHTFNATYATLTGTVFTVTVKPGDIWSWKDGYEETSAFTETNQ